MTVKDERLYSGPRMWTARSLQCEGAQGDGGGISSFFVTPIKKAANKKNIHSICPNGFCSGNALKT